METSVDSMTEDPITTARDMLLDRPWWELVLRGIMIMIFGILAIVWPGITLGVLVILFGAIVLVEGFFQMISGFQVRGEDPRWVLLVIGGTVSVAIGAMALVFPGITAWVLLLLIAAWAMVSGLMQIAMAGQMGDESGSSRWVYIIGGLIALGFSFVAFLWPGATALAIIWVIGFFAIFFGIQLIVLGLMNKGDARPVATPT
jgi:uncharacterized membrane protein HdeD (DUF308 family)